MPAGRAAASGASSSGDTLGQIQGLEERLQQAWRAGALARVAAVVAVAVFAAQVLGSISGAFSWHAGRWVFFAAAACLTVAIVLYVWTRLWIKESREPFRYTYSVADFTGTPDSSDEKLARVCKWLQRDLTLRLTDRIKRLELLPQEHIAPDTPDQPSAHIHVTGTYGVRAGADGERVIDVVPEVRIGSERCPATLGHPARVSVYDDLETLEHADSREYEQLLERVYFSVATEIYGRIRVDVERKIARLPTSYLRATAYFHEAEDYARSNTLDAFDAAKSLYDESIKLFDPRRRALPLRRWQRPVLWLVARVTPTASTWKAWASYVVPRAARGEVMAARAEIGYATTLVIRRTLGALAGRVSSPMFEAHRVAEAAVERLRPIPSTVPRRDETDFEAHVALAYARSYLGDDKSGAEALAKAQSIAPAAASSHPFYLYVAGENEPRLLRKIRLMRRAVELDPQFEIAHFQLAYYTEMLWRTRQNLSFDLEANVAELVSDEYDVVAKLDPGNLGAWANLGYVRWLLWDGNTDPDGPGSPGEAFRYGRQYKEIKQETIVAELDYGLARLHAEAGDFRRAYSYYVKAMPAGLADPREPTASGYYFEAIGEAMLRRFRRYRDNVERKLQDPAAETLPARVREAVRAFVLTDFADACAAHYQRSGDAAAFEEARSAFVAARAANPHYPVALLFHSSLESDDAPAVELLERALELEPRWEKAIYDLAYRELNLAEAASGAERARHLARAQDLLRRLIRGDCLADLRGRLGRDDAPQAPALAAWEREADDDQALALVQWARAVSLALPDPQPAFALAEHLARHFAPTDWQLLQLRRELAKKILRSGNGAGGHEAARDVLEEAEDRLGFAIANGLQADPATWNWLGNLDSVALVGGERSRVAFRRQAARAGNALAGVVVAMASLLADAGEDEAAARAYLRLAAAGDSRADGAETRVNRVVTVATFQHDAQAEELFAAAAATRAGAVSALAAACLAEIRAGRGDVHGAELARSRIEERWPTAADRAAAAVAAAQVRAQRADEAEALLRAQIAVGVETAGASALALGRLLRDRGEAAEAEQLFVAAITTSDPAVRAEALVEYVEILLARGDVYTARGISGNREASEAALAGARLAASHGWTEEAHALLRRAAAAGDVDLAARIAAALLVGTAGEARATILAVAVEDDATARELRRRIRDGHAEDLVIPLAELVADNPRARCIVAEAAARAGDGAKAIELLSAVAPEDAGEAAPAILSALGDHLAAAHRLPEAIEAYRDAIRRADFDHREAWDGLVTARDALRRGEAEDISSAWAPPEPKQRVRVRARARARAAADAVPGAGEAALP